MTIHPITDRVWVKPTEKKTKLDSGLYLPEAYMPGAKGMGKAAGHGVITAVGPEVTELQIGQYVFFSDFDGMELEYEGQYYLVMKEENIIAVHCGLKVERQAYQ